MTLTCRSCGAKVIWARTTKGKNIPLDAEPVEGGTFYLLGATAHAGDAPAAMGNTDRFVSHFATCPQAGKWRKG